MRVAGIRARLAAVAAVAPRPYWYLWWGTLINRLGSFVVPLLTIYLLTIRHLSVSETGGVIAVFGAGSIVASIAGGYLADHLGRKATLVLSLLGGAVALTGLGLAESAEAITVMVGLVGFVGELYRPAVLAFVADLIPDAQRPQAYALMHWVVNVGFACASVVGGFLADVDFRLLFIADAATMAIYGFIVLFAVPETRPARIVRTADTPRSRPWFLDSAFVAFVALELGMSMISVQAGSALAAHMTTQGFSPAGYGIVMAVNGIMIVVAQPTLTAWTVGRDPMRVMVAAALLFGVGFAMHGLGAHLALHGLAVVVWTLGEMIEPPARSSIIAAMAPADARGRYQGAVVMTYGISYLAGPKSGTWLLEHTGPASLWLGCLGLGLLVAGALALVAPTIRRRLAADSRG